MPVSHLTTSESSLLDQMVTALEGDYPFNRLTTSREQWLATVADGLTGSSHSHLTSSEAALLAAVATDLSGSTVSALTSGEAAMLAIIVNNPSEGGGGEPEGALQLNGETLQLNSEDLTLGA